MTVNELIEKLKQLDGDLEIGYSCFGYLSAIGIRITTEKEYRLGKVIGAKKVVRIY